MAMGWYDRGKWKGKEKGERAREKGEGKAYGMTGTKQHAMLRNAALGCGYASRPRYAARFPNHSVASSSSTSASR